MRLLLLLALVACRKDPDDYVPKSETAVGEVEAEVCLEDARLNQTRTQFLDAHLDLL